MAQGSIARRYAKAVMAIGVETGSYEAIGRQVASLASAMKTSQELAETLSNPAFPKSERKKIIIAVLERMGASTTTRNFILLLLDRDRLSALPDIARALATMIDEKNNRVSAEVTSAAVLDTGQLARIKAALEALSGKEVQLQHRQDPDILGGVIAKVGDIVYDGSLRTQLAQMQHSLAD